MADWLTLSGPELAEASPATRRLLAVLRYTRADGSAVFGPVGRSPDRGKALQGWADRLGDPSLSGVLERWRPARPGQALPPSPPPIPHDSRPDRPLAILRADWATRGDFLAVDHRATGTSSLIELTAMGRTWIGPTWNSPAASVVAGAALPTLNNFGTFAQAVEWSFPVGPNRITRSAVLLPARRMALLGQQEDGTGPTSEVRLALAEGVEAAIVPGSRAILLRSGRNRPPARLLPLGLPAHDGPTYRGSIAIEGREVVIRQAREGRKSWLAALICWGKPPTTWQDLTVAHNSQASTPDVAWAVRVAWSLKDEGLVVYRSLAPTELRSVLGHQTKARLLVGSFSRLGDLRPILKVD